MMEGGMLWDSQAEIYNVNNKYTLIGKDAFEASQQTQSGGVPNMDFIQLFLHPVTNIYC
jgi:hypothetical protein